jgi:hypothetical protein
MLRKSTTILTALSGLLLSLTSSAEPTVLKGAQTYGDAVTPAIVNIDMQSIRPPNKWKPGDPIREIPLINHRPKDSPFPLSSERGFGKDPLATRQEHSTNNFGINAFDTTIVNVDGSGFTGVNPSDTNGDIGNDYYVQSINSSNSSDILVLNKADGSTALSFVLDSLAAGSGTGCGGGRGDPVIFFDQFAANGQGELPGRWVLTEFTSNSFCVYVSQTSDPTSGSWFIYEFLSSTGGLPDYPKFGNWGDSYFIGANEGPVQYALDKANMVIGGTARPAQFFTGTGLPGFGFQHIMPADADGATLPPAGSPGIFMRHRDGDYHDNGTLDDVLEIFEFKVDWDTPANSTFTGPINIPVSEFDTNLGGTNFGDLSVPQPTGTNLFPLKQPLMWRLQHRTINDKQYLVGNMVTDVDGNDLHGIRWFQLERPAATVSEGWSLADEGTYTLGDTVNRWMASTAMDGDGNIAIGYNVSDANTFPGMRYAGRLTTDAAGTMPHGENSIIEGTASNGSSRWGDYSSLSVDPVDECTFWYTAQYNLSSNWSTRVASFKFEQCGCQLTLDTVVISSTTATADNTIQIAWNDSGVPEMTEYRVFRSTVSGSGYTLIGTVADSSIGVGSSGAYTFDDTTVSAGTEYFYIVRASDGASCVTLGSNESSATATGVCTLAPTFTGVNGIVNNALATCSMTIDWANASSNCPIGAMDIDYAVHRSLTPAFTPDVNNLVAEVSNLTNYLDEDANLVTHTPYYYIVRATDLDNDLQDLNLIEASTFPTGPIAPQVFNENLDSFNSIADAQAAGWSLITQAGTNDWRVEAGDGNTGSEASAFVSSDVAAVSDKSIVTKPFSPSATSVLSFFHKYQFEDGFDGGVIEVTTDGGASWQDLGAMITAGGYIATLNGGFGQPLGAVQAWTNDQLAYGAVSVDLSSLAAQLVQVRWRMGTDSSVSDGDWKIDDIVITDSGVFSSCNLVDLIYFNGFEAP